MTEVYYCPLGGDHAGNAERWPCRTRPPIILIPGQRLPPETTDEMAEHARAMMRADKWSRQADGQVIIWVEM